MKYTVKLETPNNVALFVSVCSRYHDCDIDYKVGRYIVDAKSIMGILSTSLDREAEVSINSKNSETIDSFQENIGLWIVGDKNV